MLSLSIKSKFLVAHILRSPVLNSLIQGERPISVCVVREDTATLRDDPQAEIEDNKELYKVRHSSIWHLGMSLVAQWIITKSGFSSSITVGAS